MTYQEKIQRFADIVTRDQRRDLAKNYPVLYERSPDMKDASIVPGTKYVKVDVGQSGKYMVDENGFIFGCKGYGVIHREKQYGTLETIDLYYWGDYAPLKINDDPAVNRAFRII